MADIYVPEDPYSKPYEVLSISRKKLQSLGFTYEQIALLTDEDMERIAYWLENKSLELGFDDDVKFIVHLELAEKGWKEPPVLNEGEPVAHKIPEAAYPILPEENETCVMCGVPAAWCLLGFHYCTDCLPTDEEPSG
jgi:hypothetical protein